MGGIFHQYDIRGKYPDEINKEIVENIGKAAANFLDGRNIVVGTDKRNSGPVLKKSFIKGILSQGKNVIDIGACSTPMLYFASGYLRENAAMITASHMGKEFNGIKFCRKGAVPVDMNSGLKIIEKMSKKKYANKPDGNIIKKDIMTYYQEKIRSFIDYRKRFKIVVDCSNGMAGREINKLIVKSEIIKLNFEPDGNFPAHEPNPLNPEALEQAQKAVKKNNADLGVVLDADGDRIIFIDENGKSVPGDYVTALIAHEILSGKKRKVIIDIRSSKSVDEFIKDSGVKPVRYKVGHSFIKRHMRKLGAVFAGEVSGHYYYRELWNADNSILTMIKIINLMEKTGKSLSELVRPLEKYFRTGEINFNIDDKNMVIRQIEKKYKRKAKRISHLDGLTMYFDGWWFNLRKSANDPVIRLNLEADKKTTLRKSFAEIKSFIKSF